MTYGESRLTDTELSRDRVLTPAFLLVAVATFFAFLSIGVVLPVLPRFAEGPLGAGSVGVGIAIGAASITALLAQPPAGRLGDLRGRRPLMVGGGVLMVLGAAGLTLVGHIVPVVGLRLLTGVGEALFLIGGLSIVNDLAPEHRRGEALSLYTLASYSGLAVGPVLGELVLGDDRWNTVWLLAAACGAVAGVLGLCAPETRIASAPSEGGSWLPHRLGLLPGLVLGLGLFGMGGFIAFITLYAIDVGLEGGGPLLAMFAIVVVGVRSLGAKIPDRLGAARTVRIALIALALGLAIMGLWQEPVGLYAGTFVFSVGQALAFPAVMTLAMSRTPAGDRGAVGGTVTSFVDVAIASGAIVLGGVADLGGYPAVFLVSACSAVAGLVLLQRIAGVSRVADATA
jgi:MFS family permease